MSDNNNLNDNFDWEELLRKTSAPGKDPKPASEPNKREDSKPHEPQLPKVEKPEPPVPPKPVSRPALKPVPKPEPRTRAYPQTESNEPMDEEQADFDSERDYMPIKSRRDGRIGCLGGFMYAAFIISVSIILACLGWMFASDVLALNKPEVMATITLPKETFTEREVDKKDADGSVVGKEKELAADIDYVAAQLKDAGLIDYKFLFRLYSSISHAETKIDPGTYELSTAFDYRALVKKMTTGSPSQMTTKLTFPEGYTMEQVFSLLEENNICSKDDLYDAAANDKFSYSFIDESKTGDAQRLEGLLFPDTYDFYEGERAFSVINKMLYNFYDRFTAEMIEKTENNGLTIKELITIASMIEREASSTDEDRLNIASVIYNRIEKKMPLQVDATIQYILPERVPVLTEKETSIDSPYNTYKNTGLPPTPISNPGLASIKAALDPAKTKYLYYALDTETGAHRFFTNYNEQQSFVATQDYGG